MSHQDHGAIECPFCHKRTEPDYRYCIWCGAPLR